MIEELINAKRYTVIFDRENSFILYHKGPLDPEWMSYEEAYCVLTKYLRSEKDRLMIAYYRVKSMNQFSHVEEFSASYDIAKLISNGTADSVISKIEEQILLLKLHIKNGCKQFESVKAKISRLTVNLLFWKNLIK